MPVEAGVALLGCFGSLRVDLLQVADDCLHGGVERVHVKAIEASAAQPLLLLRQAGVAAVQPVQERHDRFVAPHPGWEALQCTCVLAAETWLTNVDINC